VLGDRTERYAANAERRKYLAGLADANDRTAALLQSGVQPVEKPAEKPGEKPVEVPAEKPSAPARSVAPGDAGGDEVEADGEKESVRGSQVTRQSGTMAPTSGRTPTSG
jgi:hypothetical protein